MRDLDKGDQGSCWVNYETRLLPGGRGVVLRLRGGPDGFPPGFTSLPLLLTEGMMNGQKGGI